MDSENIYEKIQEFLGELKGNYNVLEEQIDMNLQMEYFEYSKNYRTNRTDDEIIKNKDNVFIRNMPVEDKKTMLVELASVDDVSAYRAIQKYLQDPETDFLRNWAVLAFQESRMLLESRILDENQVFISTGLGGKNGKLRYFVVLLTKNDERLTKFRKDIISKEILYALNKSHSELESLKFSNHYATFMAILPLQVSFNKLFEKAIEECNNMGNFLRTNFIITNVKKLSSKEIEDIIRKEEEFELADRKQ